MKYLQKIFVILGLVLSGCASEPPDLPADQKVTAKPTGGGPPPLSIEAKQVAAEAETAHVVEFPFSKGSDQLSGRAKAQLKKLFTEASGKGSINDVRVMSWADAEYPSVHTRKLSADQQDLAKRRGENIKGYMHELKSSLDIQVYSMAERPHAFSAWLSTTNAQLKKSLELAGIPNTDTSVKAPAKASKAIVMLLLNQP